MKLRAHILVVLALGASCFGGFAPRDKVCKDIEAIDGPPVILAVGDSSFAWKNRKCRTIPDIVALELDREVELAAVNGAKMTGGDYPITDQYRPGDWEWVIVTGGGNDINNECECGGGCDAALDRLVSEDGAAGDIPRLITQIRRDGPRVLLYGYYEIDERANYGFGDCVAEIDELRRRKSRIPDAIEGVTFVDGRDAVTVDGTPNAYASDDVHPSKEGAQLIGELIAERIQQAERTQGQ